MSSYTHNIVLYTSIMVRVIHLSLRAGLLKSFILHLKKLRETLLTYITGTDES
jgi:hypothetical protein